jgi:GntR family transcriptional regulator, carbon starvation induced regulator
LPSERLVERLRSEIVTLILPPGFKLSTQALESRYEVSLSVVREALSILAGEGLVIREDRKGFRVAPMSLSEFDNLASLRIAAEHTALEHAFTSHHSSWHSEIIVALKAMGPKVMVGDDRPLGRSWERSHRHFHFTVLNAYRSALILDILSRLYDRYDRYRSLAFPRLAYLANVDRDHATIAEEVFANDLDATRATVSRHIRDTSVTVRDAMLSQGIFDDAGALIKSFGRSS